MEKGKLTIALLLMLFITLVTIAFGNQRWVENSRKLAQAEGYTGAIENRLPETPDMDEDKDSEEEGNEEAGEEDESEEPIEQVDMEDETKTVAEKSGINPTSKTMYTTHGLNVRSDATTESERIGFYNADEKVTVTGEVNNGWVEIDYNGQKGYVLGSYLTSTKPEQTRQPTQPSQPSQPTQPHEPSEPESNEPSEPDQTTESDDENPEGSEDESN